MFFRKKKIAHYVLLFTPLFSLFPFLSLHALEIREIMYNPEGSDTNREWIEIYNETSSNVDLGQWHFFENDTHHGLYPDGFQFLAPGSRALIVKNVDEAKSELGSSLLYVKSSFSLSNTGETIALSDEDKNVVDSHTYSSDDGANGDGKSLQKINGVWIASAPTPGLKNEKDNSNSLGGSENENEQEADSKNSEPKIFNPYYTAFLEIPDVILSQSAFPFRAEVRYTTPKGMRTKLDGYYRINFGNGDVQVSSRKVDTNYSYRHPGRYLVVFDYYSSKLAFDSGSDPEVSLERVITVLPHRISIERVNPFDGVVLKNTTGKTIDLSSWVLQEGNHFFIFPQKTFLLPDEETHILYEQLGFQPILKKSFSLRLLSNSREFIDAYPKLTLTIRKKTQREKKKEVAHEKREVLNTETERERFKDIQSYSFENLPEHNGSEGNFFGDGEKSYLDSYLKKYPQKVSVDFGKEAEYSSLQDNDPFGERKMFYLLLGFIVFLGVGKFFFREKSSQKDGGEDFGTIEIIE